MCRKNWMWAMVLAVFFLATACTSNKESADSLVGTPAPAFQLADARGGQVSLDDFTEQGTPVLLYFHMAVG